MKKVLKIVGIFLLVVVVLLIAAPFLFKGKIEAAVKKAANDNLNAQVDFGDVSLSLFSSFPDLNVAIDDLRIIGVDQFEDDSLVTSGELDLVVDIKSAFGDELEVKSIALVNPYIMLKVLEDGSANYDIAKASVEDEASDESDGAEEGSFALNIEHIEIENGTFIYYDATLPYDMWLEDIDLEGNGRYEGDIFLLNTETTAMARQVDYDDVNYVYDAPMDLDAEIEMDLDAMKFTFRENALVVNELLLEADGYMALPEEGIDFDLTFATPETNLKQLLSMVPAEYAKDLAGVNAAGDFDMEGYYRGMLTDTNNPAFGVELKVDKGMFQYPDLPSAVSNIFIDAKVAAEGGADYDNISIDLPKMHAEMDGNPVDLKLLMRGLGAKAFIDADLLAKVDFEKISKALPLEGVEELRGLLNADLSFKGKLPDLDACKYDAIAAEGQFILQDFFVKSEDLLYDMEVSNAYANLTPQKLNLTKFEAMIGDNDIALDGSINNLIQYATSDCLLQGKMNLRSQKIDLNTFMEEDESEVAAEGTVAEEEEAAGVIPVPADIDFDLNANIQELIYDNVTITDVNGDLKVRDRVAGLNNVRLNTLGGSVTMDGSYATPENSEPNIDLDYNIRDLDIAKTANAFEIIKEMAPIAQYCDGKFSTSMKLKSDLDGNMSPIYSSIDGLGDIQAASLQVEKFKPLNELANQLKIDKLSQQRFKDVDIDFFVEDGKVQTKPFNLNMQGIESVISGYTDFDQNINYNVAMEVPFSMLGNSVNSQAQGLLASINSKLGSNISVGDMVPVSFTITGKVTDPQIKGNVKDLVAGAKEDVKEEVKELVKEEVKEVREDLSAQAREEADKILADAQEQADSIMAEAKKASDKFKSEGYKQADKLVAEAKNPIAKIAAEAAAKKLREKTDQGAQKIVDEAQERVDKLMAKARKEADEKVEAVKGE